METQVEDFNWNLRLFLDLLNSYQTKVQKANPTTLELLEKTVDSISDLIEHAEEDTAGLGDTILCSFDDTLFEIKRIITCRICKVDIAASRISYLLHLADPKHNSNLFGTRETIVSAKNDANNNRKMDHMDLSVKKTESVAQNRNARPTSQQKTESVTLNKNARPNSQQNTKPAQNTKQAQNSNSKAYIGSMAELIASLNKATGVEKRDLKVNDSNKTQAAHEKVAVPTVIPNVFDDNIYEFIESIGNQGIPTRMSEPLKSAEPKKQSDPPKTSSSNSKYGFNKSETAKKVSPNLDQPEAARCSWRLKPNEPVPPAEIKQWRIKKEEPNTLTRFVTSANTAPATTAPKPTVTATKVAPSLATQNGAVLTGAGVKPCATYQLDNLYKKYPHLNPNKMAQPLKPVPLKDLNGPVAGNKNGQIKPITDPKLRDFFDKVNKEQARKAHDQISRSPLRKSELTNSLMSLPVFNNNSNATVEQPARNRMPPRSSSSFNLTGISRIEGSNPQKSNRKPLQQGNGQNGNNKNQNGNNRNENGNGKAKCGQGQNGGSTSTTPTDPKSKGAIPKQPTKNTPQTSASNQQTFNNQSNSNAQKKDANEPPKTSEKNGTENKELAVVKPEQLIVVKAEQLKKFFAGDLSALICLMVNLNLRQDRITIQESIIKAIENTLKPTFTSMKCHKIGSHVYKIAKGGLTPLDVYLDLHNSFHADKSGQIFVNGMNDAQKVLVKSSNEWSDVKCNELSRYGILSATHKATNLKCNFTFGTGVTVRNTDVVNSLFDAQPVARQMAICVRLALQDGASVDWAKHFSGYVVALLVIFYLQTAGKLPSVLSLQNDPTLEIVKCGENMVHFKNPTNVPICKDRLRDLLIGFFDYYAKFDFFNKIISPFEGREINQNFRTCAVDTLSRSMRRFKSFVDVEASRWTNNKMCIQDIFEHKRNVTQNIHTKEIKAFADFCGKSLSAIRDAGNGVKY